MPIPGLSEAIGAGTSLLGGWLQQRAARRAAEEQRRAGEAAANQLTASAGESAGRIGASGEAAAAGLENAGGTAVTQVGEAGRQGQEAIGGAIRRFDPYAQAGTDALQRLTAGLGQGGEFSSQFTFDPSTAVNEAGLAYQQKQAQSALVNSGLRQGMIGGNTARALDEQTQSITSTYLRDAYDRSRGQFQMNRDNALNPLQGLVQTGLSATNSQLGGTEASAGLGADTARLQGQFGMDTARGAGGFRMGATSEAEALRQRAEQQAADLRTGSAAAGAAGTVGAGNAWADALSGVARSVDLGSFNRRRTSRPGLGVEPAYGREPLPR